MRVELTNNGFAIRRLSLLTTCAYIGTEGEVRTLEASLEDSHVASYITSAKLLELLAGLEPATSTFEASHSSS